MPTILASSILSKAKTLLQDTTGVRWGDPELLGWLNDGQREITMFRPDVYSRLASLALVVGTRQTIPSDGTAAIKVTRNMGVGGTVPGAPIRHVPMDLLDANVPDWHSRTAVAVILHATTDVRMPRTFFVYPPAIAGTFVELLYAAPPPDVTVVSAAISIDDVFAGPLVDYVCFRAYSKDQDMSGNDSRAAAHRALFEKTLSAKSQADSIVTAATANVKG